MIINPMTTRKMMPLMEMIVVQVRYSLCRAMMNYIVDADELTQLRTDEEVLKLGLTNKPVDGNLVP